MTAARAAPRAYEASYLWGVSGPHKYEGHDGLAVIDTGTAIYPNADFN